FRQTCEAPGGASVCLTGGGRAAASERRTSNAERPTQKLKTPKSSLLNINSAHSAEYRLPPHSKFIRQTCEAPGGASVCLTGGGRAAASERRTPNAEVKNS
ncbi:MAG: hypothetical protein PHS50_15010, partial [Kiritimatiellae bacterium]|nr:hypothetical protein [Kiritimatiellia bacterium]